jgi:hypothetical protein
MEMAPDADASCTNAAPPVPTNVPEKVPAPVFAAVFCFSLRPVVVVDDAELVEPLPLAGPTARMNCAALPEVPTNTLPPNLRVNAFVADALSATASPPAPTLKLKVVPAVDAADVVWLKRRPLEEVADPEKVLVATNAGPRMREVDSALPVDAEVMRLGRIAVNAAVLEDWSLISRPPFLTSNKIPVPATELDAVWQKAGATSITSIATVRYMRAIL